MLADNFIVNLETVNHSSQCGRLLELKFPKFQYHGFLVPGVWKFLSLNE